MHYKNGREAKNGDRVIMFPNGMSSAYDVPITGFLVGATPGNDSCNGYIITTLSGYSPHYANLSECLHADDVFAAFKAGSITDTSIKVN